MWILAILSVLGASAAEKAGVDFTEEWKIDPDFKIVEDAGSFYGPVGIAFVHQPSSDPKSVLYMITELRGRVQAVLQDRTVITVQEDSRVHIPDRELPDLRGEMGQSGICFSPDDQTLYTTGVYNAGVAAANSISKWKSSGPDRWKKIRRVGQLLEPFKKDRVRGGHQIGHCRVFSDGKLWVGTGDGLVMETSHLKNHSNGKILRLELDLKPARGNPFYNEKGIARYVYAMGLRNPFGLTEAFGRIYVADNGPAVDRLLRIEKGRDYPWDNTDLSMTYNNEMTLTPSFGPSDIVFVPGDHALKTLRNHLVIVASHRASLMAVPISPDKPGVTGSPRLILKPTNEIKRQDFTGIALGNDGLYITHIRMHPKEGLLPAPILKLVPSENAPAKIALTGEGLIQAKTCRSCHHVAGDGRNVGPSLELIARDLRTRLEDKAYLNKLKTFQKQDSWHETREVFLTKKGPVEDRVRLWLETKLKDPTFDHPTSAMPKIDLSDDETAAIAGFLIDVSDKNIPPGAMPDRVKFISRMTWLMNSTWIVIGVALLGGVLIGVFFRQFARGLKWILRLFRFRSRRTQGQPT